MPLAASYERWTCTEAFEAPRLVGARASTGIVLHKRNDQATGT